MTEVPPSGGRRERKKIATRDALRGAARRLFAEQGVARTSVEQISEAADVSPRTFFRYFESKYDLLLPDLAALFSELEEALDERPIDEHPLVAYEAAFTAVIVRQTALGAGMATVAAGLDPTDPALVTRLARSYVTWEQRLTDLLETRMRAAAGRAASPEMPDPDDSNTSDDGVRIRAMVTAGIAVATTRAVVRWSSRTPGAGPIDRLEMLRQSFALARAGCG